MTKVVYNQCYGGFSISPECAALIPGLKVGDIDRKYKSVDPDLPRHDPALVAAVEFLGCEKASGNMAALAIVDIESTKYRISEYDGMENVVTPAEQYWVDIDE